MKIDPKVFFDGIRPTLFGGSMNKDQVAGVNNTLDAWDKYGNDDPRQLAYVLATKYHETAKTMQPIAEYGRGKGKKYGKPDPRTGQVYYGRGDTQLTWYDNYLWAEKEFGLPLTKQPDLAMKPDLAARIQIVGMIKGVFTGHKLSQYFNDKVTDWVGARKIINGTDRDTLIAGYAKKFHAAILAAFNGTTLNAAVSIPAPPPPPPPARKSVTAWVAGTAVAAPTAITAVKETVDYANSTVTTITDTAGKVKDTVTVIRDNADTYSGLFAYVASPPVIIGLCVVAILGTGFVVWKHIRDLKVAAAQ